MALIQFNILLMLCYLVIRFLKAAMYIVCFTEYFDGMKLPNEYKYSAKGKSYNGLGGLFHLTIRPGSVSIYMWPHNISFEQQMFHQWARLESFHTAPERLCMWRIKLAKYGFYYTGSGTKCKCAFCGLVYGDWRYADDPEDVHRILSPNCPLVRDRMNSNNIPVNTTEGLQGQSVAISLTRNHTQTAVCHHGHVSRYQTREDMPDRTNTDQQYARQPALDRTNTDQQYARQPATGRASSVPDQNRPAQRDVAEDLGINLDKPKYPAYAQLNVRVSTFQGWPGYLDQTPRDMALAGFFYEGYNDYCRCFFCGGGFRNWESGDDPWVEHTRWFPKCAFVQQNRGRRFVEIIVKRQAEMQASGNSVGNTRNQRAIQTQIGTGERSETSSQSADSNSTIDPAKASVRELGYADEIIDRAITIIKQNNPGKQKIEATDIMEVIFTITEDSETNIAVASENTPSSELNLPNTSQAVPQSNVSSQSNQPVSHSSQSNKPQVSKPNPQAAVASQSTNASENSLPSLSVRSLEHGNIVAETRSLQGENIQLKEQVMCKMCMDKNVSIAFLPCGHLACCIDCAPAMRKCPICRVYIKGTVKTYLA